MPTIKVSSSVQIENGPQLSIAEAVNVDAYEKVEFTLTTSQKEKTVTLADNFSFLMIKSDLDDANPSDKKPTLSYKAGDKGFELDTSHIYLGQGFNKGLKEANVKFDKVVFTLNPVTLNEEEKQSFKGKLIDTVKIEILMGKPVPNS
jgi:hypothetical protein